MIPAFRSDGYLPEGVYSCSEAEATFRFGAGSRRRKRLVLRLRRWIELSKQIKATKLLLDGSFITAKTDPADVDAVLFVPADFNQRVVRGEEAAVLLEEMITSRRPEELFAAEDEADWQEWIEFFSRTREVDGRRKGLVEIPL
jgi:hypothetical protein